MTEVFSSSIWFFMLLPAVSFLYASVGHGGASGYLALMALFSFAPEVMKPTALMLNLFVAGMAFFHYYREGYFNRSMFWSFAISSVPFAYLGGTVILDDTIYKKVLSILLFFSVLRMLNVIGRETHQIKELKLWQGLIVGAGIGFLSGLIGIGGGIILTPVILLFHWGKMKEAACVSALFIWVNSAAGLLGQLQTGVQFSANIAILVVVALSGGFLGAFYGSKRFSSERLKQILAFVLVMASVKLWFVE